MSLDEDSLKALIQKDLPQINEAQALEKVLDRSSKITATKDIASLFIGWLWVLVLGFGGSIYSAKRKFDLHHQQQANSLATLPKNNKNTGEEQ